ncbi:hypothetical protein ALC60_02193, partial [Trachymyrmex zeteki]
VKAYILSIEDPRVIESDRNQLRARQRRCWFAFKKHESGLRCKTAEGEPGARGVVSRHRVALRVAWTPATGTASRDPTPPVGGSPGRGGEHTGNRSERDGRLGKGDAVLENVRDDNYALQDDYALLRAPFSKTTSILSRECCSTGEIGLLCPAHGIASLHGHYKAINHINRAKEAGPEGGTRCSSEDGQVECPIMMAGILFDQNLLVLRVFITDTGDFLMLSMRTENIRKRTAILRDKRFTPRIMIYDILSKILKNNSRYFSRVHPSCEKTKKRKKEVRHCGIRKDRTRLLPWRSGEEDSVGISWKAISSSWVSLTSIEGWDHIEDAADAVAPQARKIILRTARRRNGLRKWRDAACVRKKRLRREKTVVVENQQPP